MLDVDAAILSRRSVRAFLPTPVSLEQVEAILKLAGRSPSGTNIQPWRVRVLAGAAREGLSRAILDALDRDGYEKHRRTWEYYPQRWREPFLGRRRKIGWDMYAKVGVAKGDHEGTERQRRRNYDFFGAPVGMILTLDEDLEIGSWLDLGIFISTLSLAARGVGLDTCAQAAFADFHAVIRERLAIPDKELVICGVALGHADPDHPINTLETERAPLDEWASFAGFEV